MELFIDILKDTTIDTVKLIPFLFLTYLAMEYLENKAGQKTVRIDGEGDHAGSGERGGRLVYRPVRVSVHFCMGFPVYIHRRTAVALGLPAVETARGRKGICRSDNRDQENLKPEE